MNDAIRARALISASALRHNLARVRRAAPSSRVLAVVKANGYGHGSVRVARALTDADALGVACGSEAAELRAAGESRPIVILEGVFNTDELAWAAHHDCDLVVHTQEQLALLEQTDLAQAVRIWLKLDTGMHRLGFAPEELSEVWRRMQACDRVAVVRLMTHLGRADERQCATTAEQLREFERSAAAWQCEHSIANSAGVLAWPDCHRDWVRPGIMLYGASPFPDGHPATEELRPVMTLTTCLIAVTRRRRGDAIGYGATYTCPEDMPVGVAPVGYADGYPRHAPSGTPVLVNGERTPLVGRVSMDMICVDLRSQPQARPGDPVTLWGPDLPVDEIARSAETIPYELLCRVGGRVQFLDE